MEEQIIFGRRCHTNSVRDVNLEDDEEEFRSCCEDEYDLKEREESGKEGSKNNLDEASVYMFFKGVSIAGESGAGLSGIGVVMGRSTNIPSIQVQKKLDFFVDESVADYLALMDGLLEATRNKISRVLAFTDSKILHDQIVNGEKLENPLLLALRQRVMEHAEDLEVFVLELVPHIELEKPLRLAQVAIGIVSFPADGDESLVNCSICCEEKPVQMMIMLQCLHNFCSHCMRTYVDGKVNSAQVPIRCPHSGCIYYISTTECRSFLPVASYEMLERALAESNVHNSNRVYCPFPNCSVLLDPHELTRASSSSQTMNTCVECPACQRFICVQCGVPWHSSTSCEEYQNLPMEERDAGDITLHRLAQNNRWRRCQQCRRMIELAHGCFHMTCWCGHEFCYLCGTGYRDGEQTCQCAFWDEANSEDLVATHHAAEVSEQWPWDSFDSLPMISDAYTDQERSQLALIQSFLAGGFSLSDHHPYQSPPRCTDSYVDAIKDLQQLPWLERFVSVISDNYYEDYIQ